MTINNVLKVCILLGLTGCSNKAVYDNIRLYEKNECLKAPPPTQLECMDKASKSYEEYERERKALLEEDESNATHTTRP